LNKAPVLALTLVILLATYYSVTSKHSGYKIEKVEAIKIATSDKGIYILRFSGDSPIVEMINGWNITLNRSLWISNVLKYFNGSIYAAGVDVVKIRNGKIEWIKDLTVKRVSYEGTRENPIPVYYEDLLNVFDVESDGKYLYFNVRDGIVKTCEDLNVIWAVKIPGQIFDDISVSDGIYATRWNRIIKLNKDGELEWAVNLKSDEKVKLKIPEEKRRAAEKEGIKVPEFVEIPKYEIDLYAIHADKYIYVAGLLTKRLCDHREEVYPFIAKLSPNGNIVWAEIVNITYPGCDEHECIFYLSSSKILKLDERTFVAWISKMILLIFDENGKILNCYELKGDVSDVDLIDSTILLASPEKVSVEKIDASPIQINIKAVRIAFKVKRMECYSKKWEKKRMPIYISS